MNQHLANLPLELDARRSPGGLKHVLPRLPYDYAALEPFIDSHTLVVHHTKHHAGYVTNLNVALEKHPELHEHSAVWLLCNLKLVPKDIRNAVHHNAGGHVNHSLYWQLMSPTRKEISGLLADAIKRDFGGLEQLKTCFNKMGAALFGSGWVWLVRTQKNGGRLRVVTTAGHDSPLMKDCYPLLVNDVWEHAYYLKYENRRLEYLHNWWSIVNWDEVARRYEDYDSY